MGRPEDDHAGWIDGKILCLVRLDRLVDRQVDRRMTRWIDQDIDGEICKQTLKEGQTVG